jgi:hypothetical protein
MKLLIAIFTSTLLGCTGATSSAELGGVPEPPAVPVSGVYKLDFRNFSYPLPESLEGMVEGKVTLKDGKLSKFEKDKLDFEFSLGEVIYGDLLGDLEPEAVVVLGLLTGGTFNPSIIYIVEAPKDSPSGNVVWTKALGDGADEGLRSFEIKDRALVLETYNSDALTAACCPTSFTRSRYSFHTDGAKLIDQSVHDNPEREQNELQKPAR